MKIEETIKACKSIVNLPYNKFNLTNYLEILKKKYQIPLLTIIETDKDKPIKLMSGQHKNSGIIINAVPHPRSRRIFLVGKGILFDSGGYNLKRSMSTMKCDMAGMATVLAVQAHLRTAVTSYCPVTTNFLHTSQLIPGDHIRIGKKTVEITNTDAEGRLILAEALARLEVSEKDIVITVATLTGSVGYAVGEKATGILTPNDKLANLYLKASKKENEYAWRLPLWDYLDKKFKKKVIPNSSSTLPGTSMAALFLKQFVKYPNRWIHLDIAYAAFQKNKATGIPIKSLISFVRSL